MQVKRSRLLVFDIDARLYHDVSGNLYKERNDAGIKMLRRFTDNNNDVYFQVMIQGQKFFIYKDEVKKDERAATWHTKRKTAIS